MDSLDFFRQLSKGAKFTKKNNNTHKHKPDSLKQKSKKELKLLVQQDAMQDVGKPDLVAELATDELFENRIKMENDDIESEHEEPTFEFIKSESYVPAKSKKRKKPLTAAEHEQQLQEELLRILRKEQRITVQGKQIPAPIVSFEELRTQYNVSEQLVENLLSCKYPQPTAIQMQAIPIMLQGRPLMACAPTGSGKTIAFLTPIINDLRTPKKAGFRAMVLAPTRELAQQIYRECVRLSEKTALRVHFISKISQTKQRLGPDGSNKCDILISTPNRIRYLLQQEPPLLDLKSIEWFVLDEADRLMEEGQNNFKEQLDEILAACTNPSKKLALFSATYTAPVGKWALKNLKNLARVNVGFQNAATETVQQELRYVGCESGKILEIRNLVNAGLQPPVLVFVQSKERAKQLFEELLFDGVNVDIIHADRTQQQRDNCVRAFREGHIWVLICTELMGRGIDFKGVNLVINFDFPPSTISYIHRIGRTGRAGRPGNAITFYTQDDMQYLRSIAQIVKNSGGQVPAHMLHMRKMRKTETRKLANQAPKREDITTQLKSEPASRKKLMQMERMFKKQLEKAEQPSADATRLTKKLKAVQQKLKLLEDSSIQNSSKPHKGGTRQQRKIKTKTRSEE